MPESLDAAKEEIVKAALRWRACDKRDPDATVKSILLTVNRLAQAVDNYESVMNSKTDKKGANHA